MVQVERGLGCSQCGSQGHSVMQWRGWAQRHMGKQWGAAEVAQRAPALRGTSTQNLDRAEHELQLVRAAVCWHVNGEEFRVRRRMSGRQHCICTMKSSWHVFAQQASPRVRGRSMSGPALSRRHAGEGVASLCADSACHTCRVTLQLVRRRTASIMRPMRRPHMAHVGHVRA